MTTYVQNGKVIDYVNPGSTDIKYGDVIPGTDRIFIAAEDITVGDVGGIDSEGVFEFDAIDTVAFTLGQKIYWDNTAKKITDVTAGNIPAGVVIEPKDSSGTKCKVKIV